MDSINLIMELLSLLLLGCLSGFLAGLLGIGGGVILVPALYILLPSGEMHSAIGTSLAATVVAATISAWSHARYGIVDRKILWRVIPTLIIGSLLGSLLAYYFSSNMLRLIFWVVALLIGIGMFLPKVALPPLSLNTVAPFGVVLGILSSLLGIGGGIFAMPFFLACNLTTKQAIATSAVVTACSCAVGATIYWFKGGVELEAFLFIVIGSCLTTAFGARMAQRWPTSVLRQLFALMLIGTATTFVFF
jgi:uncharacterized membrane protein YfcA